MENNVEFLMANLLDIRNLFAFLHQNGQRPKLPEKVNKFLQAQIDITKKQGSTPTSFAFLRKEVDFYNSELSEVKSTIAVGDLSDSCKWVLPSDNWMLYTNPKSNVRATTRNHCRFLGGKYNPSLFMPDGIDLPQVIAPSMTKFPSMGIYFSNDITIPVAMIYWGTQALVFALDFPSSVEFKHGEKAYQKTELGEEPGAQYSFIRNVEFAERLSEALSDEEKESDDAETTVDSKEEIRRVLDPVLLDHVEHTFLDLDAEDVEWLKNVDIDTSDKTFCDLNAEGHWQKYINRFCDTLDDPYISKEGLPISCSYSLQHGTDDDLALALRRVTTALLTDDLWQELGSDSIKLSIGTFTEEEDATASLDYYLLRRRSNNFLKMFKERYNVEIDDVTSLYSSILNYFRPSGWDYIYCNTAPARVSGFKQLPSKMHVDIQKSTAHEKSKDVRDLIRWCNENDIDIPVFLQKK